MTQEEFKDNLLNYRNSLFLKAIKFTKEPNDANDLVQDTLLKATRFASKFQYGSDIEAWLYVIMRNTFYNNKLARTKLRKVIIQTEVITSAQLMKTPISNAGEDAFAMRDINKVIDNLPKDYSVPFLRLCEGYTYEEISSELGISLAIVKNRIHLARQRLQKKLKKFR